MVDLPTGVGNNWDMNKTAETTKTLFQNTNGAVVCEQHIGYSAQQVLTNRPTAKRIKTDLTIWNRMTEADTADWMEFMAEMNHTEGCESCRSNNK